MQKEPHRPAGDFGMLRVEQEQQYQKEREDLEALNKQLKNTKEQLSTMSLKAHLLQVDLATQFNPFTVETIKSTQDVCEQCLATVDGKNY